MRDHTKLKAFQLADSLLIYSISRKFPEDERFGLMSQMRRAAVSTAANIVEGSARDSEKEYVRLLSIAYASAKELQYEISLAIRLGYLRNEDAARSQRNALETCKALWALIDAIKSQQI